MKIESRKIKNGPCLIFVKMDYLKSFSGCLSFNAGVKDESIQDNGISHLLEHLLCRRIENKIAHLGYQIKGRTYKETMDYSFHILAKDAMPVLAKILFVLSSPFLPTEKEIKIEKDIITAEWQGREENNTILTEDKLEGLMYPDSYIARDTCGTPKTLKNINRKKVLSYYKNNYPLSNLVACFVGNITPEIKNEIVKMLEDNPSNNKPLSNQPPELEVKRQKAKSNSTKHFAFQKRNTDDIVLVIAFKGFSANNKSKYLLRLLALILAFGHSSRLFRTIREENGLIYEMNSFCVEYIHEGYLEIRIYCEKKNITKVAKILKKELDFSRCPIEMKELKAAKNIFTNDAVLSILEDPQAESEYITEEFIKTGKILDIEKRTLGLIKEATLKQLQDTAKKVIATENAFVSVVGNLNKQHIQCLKTLLK